MLFKGKNLLLVHALITIIFISSSFASDSEVMSLAMQIDTLDALVSTFENECVRDGKLRSDIEWCNQEKKRLDQDYDRLQKLADSQAIYTNSTCEDSKYDELGSLIDEAVKSSLSHEISCDNNTKILSSKCVAELGCEIAHSMNHYYKPASIMSPLATCNEVGGYKNSCTQSITRGLLTNLQHGYEAVTHFLPQLVVQAANKGWETINNLENISTENLMIATQLSDLNIINWTKSTITSVKDFVLAFFSLIGESIKSSFGCETWSGVPYYSECTKSMTSWDCSSCHQRINAICGVIGYMGAGEAITSYLTGGAAGLVSSVYKFASKFATIGRVTRIPISVTNLPESLNYVKKSNSITISTAMKSLKQLPQIRLRLHAFKPIEVSRDIALSSLKVVAYPFNQYFRLLDVSTKLGYHHGEKVIYAAGDLTTKVTLAVTLSTNPINKSAPVITDTKTLELIKSRKEIDMGTFKLKIHDNNVIIKETRKSAP